MGHLGPVTMQWVVHFFQYPRDQAAGWQIASHRACVRSWPAPFTSRTWGSLVAGWDPVEASSVELFAGPPSRFETFSTIIYSSTSRPLIPSLPNTPGIDDRQVIWVMNDASGKPNRVGGAIFWDPQKPFDIDMHAMLLQL